MDQLEADEDLEQTEIIENECEATATIKCVEPNLENNKLPKLMYMAFKRKSGCRMVYGQFLREIMQSMKQFQVYAKDLPQQEEELVEEIAKEQEEKEKVADSSDHN